MRLVMKKAFLISIALCLAVLTACSSAGYKSDNAISTEEGKQYAYNDEAAAETGAALAPDAGKANNTAVASSVKSNKKIIKNASLDMEAKDVIKCYDEILNYAESKGGYEVSQNMTKNTDYSTMNATIKISPDELDGVLLYARDCGNVINTNVSSNDITAEYTDTKIRLDNKKRNLQKYYEYYDKAQNMEEALMLQKEIDNLTAEIESYEGQIKMWNELVSESTIQLYIKQTNDPNKIKEEIEWNSISFETMGRIMRNGFKTVINILISCVQWLVIILVTISPILIIAAIVLLIMRLRHKKKKASLPKQEPPKEISTKE